MKSIYRPRLAGNGEVDKTNLLESVAQVPGAMAIALEGIVLFMTELGAALMS